VQHSIARETPYKYDFHLLADSQTWQTATMGATVGAGDMVSIVGSIGQNTLLKKWSW
tara:strand:+ start:1903 stop:2073 length:171 start_codon:yes stop_codon:yes gene_type:complete